MNVKIQYYNSWTEFYLKPITQLCGQNILRKNIVINSFCKYFSSEKYAEYEQNYIDNTYLNGENVGRRYFKVIRISSRSQLLNALNIGKTSLLNTYIKKLVNDFDCQNKLEKIDELLSQIYIELNNELKQSIGKIELDYNVSELWDIIQKADLKMTNGEYLESVSSIELLNVFINVLVGILEDEPVKSVIVFDNIDHLIALKEYRQFVSKCSEISDRFDIYFIFLTSLDGYVYIDEDNLEGITVFNQEVFTFPSVDKLTYFTKNNYPFNRTFDDNELMEILTKIVQKIGKKNYILENEEMVICKMINDSLMIKEYRKKADNIAENCFLNGEDVL